MKLDMFKNGKIMWFWQDIVVCGYDLVVMIVASQAIHTGSNPVIRMVTYHNIRMELDEMGVRKEAVQVGDRVQLLFITDTMTRLKVGAKGTVVKIDKDQELIWVDWDNGEHLALLMGIDKFKIVKK